MRKNIDIVILHFGDISTTQHCLESLDRYKSSFRDIIIINNDPELDIATIIDSRSNRILHNAKKNVGFAAGVNQGIKIALDNKAEFVLLLNNDTKIGMNIFSPLSEFLSKNERAGIAGPVIEFQKDGQKMYDYGGYISKLFGKTRHDNRREYTKSDPFMVHYVSGCCMMIKKEVFEKIGHFDEQFFMYYEDVDFCLRAKKADIHTFVVANIKIYHELSKSAQSTPFTLSYLLSSARIFHKKYHFPLSLLFEIYQSCLFVLRKPNTIKMVLNSWR